MRLPDARVATAVAVIGLSALAVSRGWDIVHFSIARAGAASPERRADAVRPWIGVTGLAGAALEASLADVVDPADGDAIRRRADGLASTLSVRPVSSMDWLSLASMRLMMGQPSDKVLAAFALSSLTGPNEGHVMSQRALFALWQWEILPPHLRKRMAADLAGAIRARAMSDQERTAAHGILIAKPADVRREIADLLRAQGFSTNDLGRIGL